VGTLIRGSQCEASRGKKKKKEEEEGVSKIQFQRISWVWLVVLACKPSYSGGVSGRTVV
jgi:hypothetical protein